MTVRDTRKEAKSEQEIVKVSGMKRSLACPSRNTVGMKTTMVVIVETKMGMATSRAASRTARRRGLPGMLRWRLMFSSSTMESSTSRPTARASPPSVKTLSVWPSMYMATSVSSSDSGMAMEMMTVETKERRKIRMTRKARMEPTVASCQRLWMDWRMYVDWSKVRLTLTPGGTPSRPGTVRRTASTTSTVLAPGCLFTRRYTARSPLTRTMDCWVSAESSTRPRSRTRTGLPSTRRTTMSSIGSTTEN